jgi:hypothetical protein
VLQDAGFASKQASEDIEDALQVRRRNLFDFPPSSLKHLGGAVDG